MGNGEMGNGEVGNGEVGNGEVGRHGTNNGPESFHRHFNAQFTSPHPTFFIFWGMRL